MVEDEISINSLLTKIYGNKYRYNFRGAYRRPPCQKAELRQASIGALRVIKPNCAGRLKALSVSQTQNF